MMDGRVRVDPTCREIQKIQNIQKTQRERERERERARVEFGEGCLARGGVGGRALGAPHERRRGECMVRCNA